MPPSTFRRPPAAPACPDRRRLILGSGAALGGLLVGGALAGCRRRAPLLRIGSNVWPGYELLYLARARSYFDVDIVRMVELPSATACLQALGAGAIEGACLTLDEVLTARADGLPLKVVTVLDLSQGADALLARPEITSLAALRGRRLGVEQSAVGAVMLDAILRSAGLERKDVEIRHMNVNAHRDAFVAGKVDAIITFEPVISQLAAGAPRRLFDSADIPSRIVDVLAVLPEVRERNPKELRALIRGHFRARAEFLQEPGAASTVLARRLQLPPDSVPAAFQGLQLPDVGENRQWLSGRGEKLTAAAASLAQVMLQAQLLPRPVDTSNLADGRFLP